MRLIKLIIFCLLLSSCEKFGDHRYALNIKNNSSYRIAAYAKYILPDTTLLSITTPDLEYANPNNFIEIRDNEVNDEKFERFQTEKLTIFIFSSDTISKYPWDSIKINYNILMRYELNKDDYHNMGGIVNYP